MQTLKTLKMKKQFLKSVVVAISAFSLIASCANKNVGVKFIGAECEDKKIESLKAEELKINEKSEKKSDVKLKKSGKNAKKAKKAKKVNSLK